MAVEDNKEDGKIVAFKLRKNEYALDVRYVLSIEKMLSITRIPNVPPYILGVVNLRGVIIPIIDLSNRLEMGESEFSGETRIIIVEIDKKQVGLIVDNANDVIEMDKENIEPQPDVIGHEKKDYIDGVIKIADRLLILLNLEKLLSKQENGI